MKKTSKKDRSAQPKSSQASPRSARRHSSPVKKSLPVKDPIAAEVDERFESIQLQEDQHNPADGTQIFQPETTNRLLQTAGLEEPGALDEPEAPKDTVTIMEDAEKKDTIASGELEIPAETGRQSQGDSTIDSDLAQQEAVSDQAEHLEESSPERSA